MPDMMFPIPIVGFLLSLLGKGLYVYVHFDREGNKKKHTLKIHNQSKRTVQLIKLKIEPKGIPIGFGQSGCISEQKIVIDKKIFPGDSINVEIDLKAIDTKEIKGVRVKLNNT